MSPQNDDEELSLRDTIGEAWEAWDKSPEAAEEARFNIPDERKPSEHKTRSEGEIEGAAKGGRPDGQDRQQADSRETPSAAGGERHRDESGRFAPKPKDGQDETKPAAGAQDQQTQDSKPNEQSQAPAQAPNANVPPAPETFSEAGRQAWQQLHPEIRQHIERTAQEHQRQIQGFAAPLMPLHEMSQRRGMSWKEGLERLTTAQQRLDQNPAEALIWLANAYRVNLDELADRAATRQQQPAAADPINSLNSIIAPLHQRVQQLEGTLTERQQAEQSARETAVIREINTFASQNPHFDKVANEVMALIPAVRQMKGPGASNQDVLREAYDRAIYANPEVRALVLAEQRQAADEQRRQEQQTRTRNARALEIVTGHKGNGAVPPPRMQNGTGGSVRDDINAAWDAFEAANQ